MQAIPDPTASGNSAATQLCSGQPLAAAWNQMVSAPRTPVMNPCAERVIGTLRRECLDQLIVFGQSHAQRLLDEFADHHNAQRPHQSLNGERPDINSVSSARAPSWLDLTSADGTTACRAA